MLIEMMDNEAKMKQRKLIISHERAGGREAKVEGNECLPSTRATRPRPGLGGATGETERLLPNEGMGETERFLPGDT